MRCLTALALLAACQQTTRADIPDNEPKIEPTDGHDGLALLVVGGTQFPLETGRRHFQMRRLIFDRTTELIAEATDPEAQVIVRLESPTGALLDPDWRSPGPLSFNQRLEIEVHDGGEVRSWSVNLPPPDLPPVEVAGAPTDQFFFVAPRDIGSAGVPSGYGRYLLAFDGWGVPVWWFPVAGSSFDLRPAAVGGLSANARLIADDDLLSVRFDGQTGLIAETWRPEPVAGWETTDPDAHEVFFLADGTAVNSINGEDHIDLSAIGSVDDWAKHAGIQERAPDGTVRTVWTTEGAVDLAALPPEAIAFETLNRAFPYGHINSIEAVDGGYVVSLRSSNQVVRIDSATGEILWRLGGPHSDFSFPNDPRNGSYGQHSARWLAGDHVLLFDNGTNFGSEPTGPTRAVEYALDHDAGTATIVWEHELDGVAAFEGSVQRLEDGSTLIGAGTQLELTDGSTAPSALIVGADGTVGTTFQLPYPMFSYRFWAAPGDPVAGW